MIAVFDGSDLTAPGAEAQDVLIIAGYSVSREGMGDLLSWVSLFENRIP